MRKLLYLEGASGISGDMTVAALLDLGGSRKKLDAVLNSLRLEGFDYTVSRRKSCGVEGCDFDVHLHEHHHEAEHHHTHRNLADVCAVIDRGDMSRRARDLAKSSGSSRKRKPGHTDTPLRRFIFTKSEPSIPSWTSWRLPF